MELWFMIKERLPFLSFFILFILLSVILLVATWKKRTHIPKTLIAIISVVSSIFIVASLIAMVFIISFGYNS